MEKTDLCCLCLRRKTLLPESRISQRLRPYILRNTIDLREDVKMAVSNIKALIPSELRQVWELVLDIENYAAWRSDLSKTEVISDKQFIEYTKGGYSTTFTVTVVEPYKRWEFDMENSNMKGHWIGIFTDKGNETEIDFTERVEAKKLFMKLFVKSYLRKQQAQFVADIRKALGGV